MALRPEPLMLCFVIHQLTALLFGSNTLGYTRLLLNDLISPLVMAEALVICPESEEGIAAGQLVTLHPLE